MKRHLLFLCFGLLFFLPSKAEHITGGEMYYRLDSVRGGEYYYTVTLKLFRDCYSTGATLDQTAAIAVYDAGTRVLVNNLSVNLDSIKRLELSDPGKCITNAPTVCYEAGYYSTQVRLAASQGGYILAYQRCCRINGINNLFASGTEGATYTATIPGLNRGLDAPRNSSARFVGIDTIIVCGGYPFTYDFSAVDPDGDVLRYSFCQAYVGGGQTGRSPAPNSPTPNPATAPPYNSVTYAFPYSSIAPLGPNISINPNTGVISGLSPEQGIYVVTVCVEEIRNGVVIATQRKDMQIKASGCDIAKPALEPEHIYCDGLTVNFSHFNNPLITTYEWTFGDPASGANNTSNLQNPTHSFSQPGNYTIKLVANRGQECADSTTAIVRVWPGFFPDFDITGVCLLNDVQFTDRTTANHGAVNSWHWDFGDAGNIDNSTVQNPNYRYSAPGTKNVRLIVGSSVGCMDTIYKTVDIIDKPPITLAFKDTLICSVDPLQLSASGTGQFTWSPNQFINNPNIPNPIVQPPTTRWYKVTLDEQGCINEDSVLVRVVDFVTLNAMPDTTICLTDSLQLRIESDGLRYSWTPANSLNDPTLKMPMAGPTGTTTYQVIARIGTCSAADNVTVTTVPYPIANAGADTTICYNTSATLRGSHDGNRFLWTPSASLLNATTLTPTAFPPRTMEYVLSSYDIKGCPKPGHDTVLVTVLPKIIPFAGNDTMVVVGQPVQFMATGGVAYQWIPTSFLSNPNISNPIAVYDASIDSIRYLVRVYNEIGCYDSASIKVTVFKTQPTVFVPTGFTPNGDGLNDVLRPIAVGVQRINYFRVFNRWGQQVFQTTTNGAGWDGRINGSLQASNVYAWMVSATDYLGKEIFLKGTSTLIR